MHVHACFTFTFKRPMILHSLLQEVFQAQAMKNLAAQLVNNYKPREFQPPCWTVFWKISRFLLENPIGHKDL